MTIATTTRLMCLIMARAAQRFWQTVLQSLQPANRLVVRVSEMVALTAGEWPMFVRNVALEVTAGATAMAACELCLDLQPQQEDDVSCPPYIRNDRLTHCYYSCCWHWPSYHVCRRVVVRQTHTNHSLTLPFSLSFSLSKCI